MDKFIITINEGPYCGDDCEPGYGDIIYYDNICRAQTALMSILKNWELDEDDILQIESITPPYLPNLPVLKIKKLKI